MAVLAVDAGGTYIKLGFVESGCVISRSILDSCSQREFGTRLPLIAEGLRELIPADAKIEGLGMAFPSLTTGTCVVGNVGKYFDAPKLDLAEWVRSEFGVDFVLEGDARMACLGEWKYGAGREHQNIVVVTLGTGIGTGVVVDGRMLFGANRAAGILGGHMTARMDGRLCPCGNKGCWETEASTVHLQEIRKSLDSDRLEESHPFSDYETIFSAAKQGDDIAIKIRDHSIQVWAALITSLIHAYDPEIVILGGGVMESHEEIIEPLREIVHRSTWNVLGKTPIFASELGSDAALLACEWLVQNRWEQPV